MKNFQYLLFIVLGAVLIIGSVSLITKQSPVTVSVSKPLSEATSIPSITVLSPNRGEQWQKGSTQTIRWNSSGVTQVYLKLWKESAHDSILPIGGFEPFPNKGFYTWTIPKDLPAGQDYKVGVFSLISNTWWGSNFFTILPTVTVNKSSKSRGSGSVQYRSSFGTYTCSNFPCSLSYKFDTNVALAPFSNTDSVAGPWSACDSTSGPNNTGICQLKVNGDRSATIIFNVKK